MIITMTRAPGPLAHAPFRWLVAARTTALLGNAVAPVALAFAVLDLTGSAADLGLVVAARSLANVALLLLGGVVADRLPRQVVLTGSCLAAAATQGGVAALVLTGSATVPLLAALGALNGAVSAVSLPASSALTPQTVPAAQLRAANTLIRIGVNTALVLGASAGGLLVATVGPGWGLAVDAAGFLLAAVLFARVRPTSAAAAAAGRSLLADLRDGWAEFTSRRWVWVVVAQFAVVNAAFVGSTAVLGPVVADATFGRAGWGLVLAAQAVGLFAGGVVALRWQPRRALGVGVAATALLSLPAAALALTPHVAVLVAVAFVAGLALEQFGIAWDVSLQENVPADRLARVYSYDALGSFAAIPAGQAAVGPIADAVGVGPTLLGCAAAVLLATGAALATRGVRTLERGAVGGAEPGYG
jgi:predicted MFS family arabinose efflux permease